jgi:lysophospholipase L1-like esterase
MASASTNSATPIVGQVRYLALGDSTGAGVGARSGGYVARLFRKIVAQRPESKLTNRCISGATTSDLLNEQMDGMTELDPNLVTIGIGINDIGHGVSLSTFEKNYDLILNRLRASTRAVIVVTNIPDISTAPRIPQIMRSQYEQIILQYNQKLKEVAARHGVTVFDVYTITREELPKHPEYFSADGFHPSDQGYELWAETMWPSIARVVGADAPK